MFPNRGQWDERIEYSVDLNSGKLLIEKEGIVFFLTNVLAHNHTNEKEEHPSLNQAIKQRFINPNKSSTPLENDSSMVKRNYFLGNDKDKWMSDICGYAKIVYPNYYEKIDLFYSGKKGQLSYNFRVKPGGSPDVIKMSIDGASSMHLEKNGDLVIETIFGNIVQSKPRAYTIIEGQKKEIFASFQLRNNELSFYIDSTYDNSLELIIDPSLTFSTFTGSTADNWGFTATPDINGNLFGGGIVFGTGYPLTTGVYDMTFNGGTGSFPMDVGITKYNENGTNILYSTYIGGSGNETPHSIISAPNGELFIYGVTSSNNFPMAGTPYDNTYNGGPNVTENSLNFDGADIYVARLSANGSTLMASTYIGGSGTDGLNTTMLHYNYGDQFRGEITLDNNQNVYISSTTQSSNFPTIGAAQGSLNGTQDAVIFKLNSSLSTLQWSTFFGGTSEETGNSLSIGNNGYLYVAGGTSSFSLPIASGNDLTFNGGTSDGYLIRLNAMSGSIVSGTYMGANEYDQTYFVDTDPDNGVYVYGQTESAWNISPSCYGIPNSGQFIRKYSEDLMNIDWTTMLGAGTGHVEISPTAFLISDCYDIYLAGWGGVLNQNGQASFSTSNGFPVTMDAFQLVTNGSNFYLAVLDQDASNLKYATFMGGTSSSYNHVDGGTSRFDKSGRIYHAVCGACGGNDYGFTSTPGSWSPTNNSSNCNMATFKFELSTIQAAAAQPAPLICIPQSVYFQNNSTNGNAYLWDFGDGNTSTEFEPIYQYATPGIYDVTLTVLDTNGCFSADAVTITVNIGAFTGGVTAPSSPICPGESFQFDAYGGANYSWSPASFLDNSSVPNPIANIQQTTTFNVTISDSCGSVTVPVTLEVYDNSISISPDTSLCIGAQAPIEVNGSGTVSWEPPTYLNDPNSFNPISTPEAPTTYIATVTNEFGCVNSDSIFINVFYNPPIPEMEDTLEICNGGSASLTISGGDTYLWVESPYLNVLTGNSVVANPPTENWFYCNVSNSCGTVIDSILVQVVEPQIYAGNDTTICPNELAYLWASGADYYQWFPSNTVENSSNSGAMVAVKPTQSTNYMVIGSDQNGCVDTARVMVTLFPYPSLFVTSDVYAFYGDEIQLEAYSHFPGTYTWSPSEYLSCINCTNPIANPNENITYFVSFEDINGCTSNSYVNIHYDALVYVPNTFIPDENGINDVFKVYGGNIMEMECLIFNRWGQLIHTITEPNGSWDGTYKGIPCQDGTYTWKLIYKDFLGNKDILTGHVNLLR